MTEPNNSKTSETKAAKTVKATEKVYDLSNVGDMFEVIQLDSDKIKEEIFATHLRKLADQYQVSDYEIVFLFDDFYSISSNHSNRIYNAISNLKKDKNILLILVSDGGKIEPAYLISKTCTRLKKDKFAVSIPRRAKSAATLIALGADEIHMGMLSELGPIDPQLKGLPALGVSNALERLAGLTSQYPAAGEMFSKYLTANLNLHELGYFERINESAAQYAERLLKGKALPSSYNPHTLANHFTNHYKDHSFVIDSEEALSLLGEAVVRENENEYLFGDAVYKFLDFANFASDILTNKTITYVGSISDGLSFHSKKK